MIIVKGDKMIGIILVVGVGFCLWFMINSKFKCFVIVVGKFILDYQLNFYCLVGIKDIFIIVGYEGDKIKKYCKYIKDFNIIIIENNEYEDINNMYLFFLVKKYVYGEFFILNNVDLVIDLNIIEKICESFFSDFIVVDVGVFNEEFMKVIVNDDNKVSNIFKLIDEKEFVGCFIDFYKFFKDLSKIFFDEIE